MRNTMVGQILEVIYKTSEGTICKVLSHPETTDHLKKMRVAYAHLLITDCNNSGNPCVAKIVQSGNRVHITTGETTVLVSKNCSK